MRGEQLGWRCLLCECEVGRGYLFCEVGVGGRKRGRDGGGGRMVEVERVALEVLWW